MRNDALRIFLLSAEEQYSFAAKLVEIAEDDHESRIHRTEALDALSVMAPELSTSNRVELFDRTLAMTDSDASDSAFDTILGQLAHPLSRFQINVTIGALEPYALAASAELATQDEQKHEVVRRSLSALATADPETTHRIAIALSRIGREYLRDAQHIFAGQQQASLRALASVIWVHDPDRAVDLGLRLAKDPDALVRRSLAREIASTEAIEKSHPVYQKLLVDSRYSVRSRLLKPMISTDSETSKSNPEG